MAYKIKFTNIYIYIYIYIYILILVLACGNICMFWVSRCGIICIYDLGCGAPHNPWCLTCSVNLNYIIWLHSFKVLNINICKYNHLYFIWAIKIDFLMFFCKLLFFGTQGLYIHLSHKASLLIGKKREPLVIKYIQIGPYPMLRTCWVAGAILITVQSKLVLHTLFILHKF